MFDSIELIKLIISVMWQIWKGRNALIFNEENYEPSEIVNKALFDYHEYEDNLLTNHFTLCITDCPNDKNIVLVQDGIILFANASLHKERKMSSIGVTAMDSCGKLLQAFGVLFQFVGKVITAEALAIRESLEKAMENGWTRVQFLSDAKNVVDMILKRSIVSWEIETTCKDIWKLMGFLIM
ncbi:hypothetical protein P3L10_003214 [Capsicum annuum]